MLMSSTEENEANKAAYEIESTGEKDTQYTVPPLSSSYPVNQSKWPLPNEVKNRNYNAGSRLKSRICESEDSGAASMASKMKRKHDKYWGNIDVINIFLFITVVFDPRFKLNYVNWVIEHSYDVNNVVLLKSKVQVVWHLCLRLMEHIYHALSKW
ncbi:hAT-like transposase, RNase-H fold [Dillenia turbinata]|uniref:HAT-like transposase, RNase-H fold n=1 Tax=Dillenia turbinata TaxID=194707 RepID=A0AAN8VSF4_9MAGN